MREKIIFINMLFYSYEQVIYIFLKVIHKMWINIFV